MPRPPLRHLAWLVLVALAACGTSASSNKQITELAFFASDNPGLTNNIEATVQGTSIAATLPAGTAKTALVARFTTTGEMVTVDGVVQGSGVTTNDFTHPVTYEVTAADGSTQSYTVTVTVTGESDKAITWFGFRSADNPGLTGDVVASISGTSITAMLPYGSDVTHLVASFATTGASVAVGPIVQVSGTTANDFTTPVAYRVTAPDSSTQDYTVTITVASSSAKDITTYRFLVTDNPGLPGNVNATILGTAIMASVSDEVDRSALVARFTTTGVSVTVGATPQVSGSTANDFTAPVVYHVVAADGSTRDFTVTLTPVDITPPTVTITSSPASLNNQLTATFAFTVGADAVSVECSIDGSAFAACTSPQSYAVGDGDHTFVVRASDAAGNVGSDSRAFTIDTVPPQVAITSGPTLPTGDLGPAAVTTDPTPAFTATTFDAQPVSSLCSIDGAALAPCNGSLIGLGHLVMSPLAVGTHTFEIQVSDAAGNTGSASLAFVVDLTPPVLSIDSHPDVYTSDNHPTFTFSATNAVSFTCRIATLYGQDFYGPCTSPFSTTLPSSQYVRVFTVVATDASGGTATKSFAWRQDARAPSLAVVTDHGGYATGEDVTVTWRNVANDRVTILSGSNPVLEIPTGGASSGTVTFAGGLAIAGTYAAYVHSGSGMSGGVVSDSFAVASCPAQPIIGNVNITSAADAAPYATATSISGTLSILALNETNPIQFPCLQQVGALSFNPGGWSYTPFSAPRLTTVTGNAYIGGDAPDLPSLATIGTLTFDWYSAFDAAHSYFYARRLTSLGALSVPGDYASIEGLESVTTIQGDLNINMNGTEGSLGGLIGLVSVGGTVTVPDIGLDGLQNLQTVGGNVDLWLGYLANTDTNALLSLRRVVGDLNIRAYSMLADITLPSLEQVQRLWVTGPGTAYYPMSLARLVAPRLSIASRIGVSNTYLRCEYPAQIAEQISPLPEFFCLPPPPPD